MTIKELSDVPELMIYWSLETQSSGLLYLRMTAERTTLFMHDIECVHWTLHYISEDLVVQYPRSQVHSVDLPLSSLAMSTAKGKKKYNSSPRSST